MKLAKLYTVVAAGAALMGLASCSEVTDPKYQIPDQTKFLMVTPAFQNEIIELTPDGTFTLGVNAQPNYGFSAVTQYRVLVALTDDFTDEEKYIELTPNGSGTLVNMTFDDVLLSEALTELLGVESADDFPSAPMKVYFKGTALIKGIESSFVMTANTVTLNYVKGYYAVAQPGEIYVIGNYIVDDTVTPKIDWIAPTAGNQEKLEPYTLREKEDAIRSKIYYGEVLFKNTSNNCTFRFYTALNGWDNKPDDGQPMNSIGPAGGSNNDTPVKFPNFVAGSELIDSPLTPTKDSFEFTNYMGKLSFEVNLKDPDNMTATIKAVAAE